MQISSYLSLMLGTYITHCLATKTEHDQTNIIMGYANVHVLLFDQPVAIPRWSSVMSLGSV